MSTAVAPIESLPAADPLDVAREHIGNVVNLIEVARGQLTENEYPHRALGIAHEMAGNVMRGQVDIFDALAVLSGALKLTTGQQAVTNILKRGLAAGEAAADALEHVDRQEGLVRITPAPDSTVHFNGHSTDQLTGTLEAITSAAFTLRGHLELSLMRADSADTPRLHTATDIQMAQASAALIGSLADQLLGWSMMGSAAGWSTGDDMSLPEDAA